MIEINNFFFNSLVHTEPVTNRGLKLTPCIIRGIAFSLGNQLLEDCKVT